MLDDYQDLIDELLQAPAAIRSLLGEAGIQGASPEAAAMIATLTLRDERVLERLQRLTRQTSANFTALPPFDDALAGTTPPDDRDALMATFETHRGELVSLLMNLTLKDWERVATHDELGEVTLAEEVESHVEFDETLRERLAATTR